MKLNKLILLIFLFLSGTIQQVNAQKTKSTDVNKAAQILTDTMVKRYGLTADQKTKALAINKKAAQALSDLGVKTGKDDSYSGLPFTRDVITILRKRDAEMAKVLTENQYKIYQEYAAKRYADMWTKTMEMQLDLTETQYPKVYNANLNEIKAIMKQMNKMKSAKNEAGRIAAKEELKPATVEKELVMKGILTPPQFVKYKENQAATREAIKEELKK